MKPFYKSADPAIVIGVVCFLLGIASIVIAQKLFTHPKGVSVGFNPPLVHQNADSLFDPFENMDRMRSQMLQPFHPAVSSSEITKGEDHDFIYYDIATKDLNKEKLKVKVEDGQISISGEVEKKSADGDSEAYYTSSFHRSFPAPAEVDAERFQMEQLKDSLRLKFPKRSGA